MVALGGAPANARFDVVIRGGTVIDGSASAVAVRADVGIDGDRITAIGDLRHSDAALAIPADTLVIAPGFIDPHTHVEPFLVTSSPDALAPVLQGVTTCLTSPDGFGWAPLTEEQSRALWASTGGINGPYPTGLDTTSVDTYLAGFEGRTASNLLPQVPLASIRFATMGWDAGPATGRQLTAMRSLVGQWMTAGATGLSVGLDYEPGARTDETELTALCDEIGAAGGTLAAHLRYEDAGRAASWAEVARIGDRAGIRVVIAHETLDDEGARLLERAQAIADVMIETYLYPAASTHLAMFVPATDRIGGPQAIASRLRQPAVAARIARALTATLGGLIADGERITFSASADATRIGADLERLALDLGTDVGNVAVGVLRDDVDALFAFHHPRSLASEQAAARTIANSATIVASDGIYRAGRMHPRGCGTFPRIIRKAVHEWGVLSLAQAIHAMTGRTADRYRVPERGLVQVGRIADLVVFDPSTIADRATWEEPRLKPAGISHVLVAGEPVVLDSRPTGRRPGRVLSAA